MLENLKKRWNITSNFQLIIIFIVFAINGTISARLSDYFMGILQLTPYNIHMFLFYFIFLIIVLPIYPFMLMVIGFLFGQSVFFFPFAKKLLRSIGLGFIFKS